MVMMEETYHQMEAEDGEATSGAAYSNVLEVRFALSKLFRNEG